MMSEGPFIVMMVFIGSIGTLRNSNMIPTDWPNVHIPVMFLPHMFTKTFLDLKTQNKMSVFTLLYFTIFNFLIIDWLIYIMAI